MSDREELAESGSNMIESRLSSVRVAEEPISNPGGARRPFSLTMEVPFFLTMLSVALSGSAISNILLYRTCIHTLHYSEEECHEFLLPDKTNTSQKLEDEVQKYKTYVTMTKMILEAICPAALSVFLGVWSDTYGRKPLVVWPVLGMALAAMVTVVFAVIPSMGPWWYLLTAIPIAFSGGFTLAFTGAFTYISDITTPETRSIRMMILEGCIAAGSVVGSLLSSFLLKEIGTVYVLLITATIMSFAYVFTNLCIPESLEGASPGGFREIFDTSLAKDMLTTCLKRRPNFGRAQILLLCSANSLAIFILYGSFDLKYMFTRNQLHWSIREYSIYDASDTIIATFMGVATVKLAQMYKVGDLPLATSAFVSATLGFVVTAFAVKSWTMYVAAILSALKGLSTPVVRSHLSKSTPVEDIAKVMTLICVLESLAPMLSPFLFGSLYVYTVDVFPGAFLLLSAGLTTCCAIMILIVRYLMWKCSYVTLLEDSTVEADEQTHS